MILPLLLLAAPVRAAAPASVVGSVVRSKEWIVRRGKAQEEEFVGDVRYDATGDHLSADWALFRHAEDDWRVKGRVVARREFADGDVVEVRGDHGYFSRKTAQGSLEPAAGGRVALQRTPKSGEPDRAEGDRLDWLGERSAALSGRARGWGPRGEFWAQKAAYARAPVQSLTLSGGRPVLRSLQEGVSAVKADELVAFDAPRRYEAHGRAMGWMLMEPREEKGKPGSRPACVETAAPAAPVSGDAVSALLAPQGSPETDDARFWEAKTAAASARACWGSRVDFWADSADEAETPSRRLSLTGGRPVLRKLDSDWSTAIKADAIEAADAHRRIQARGQVVGWLIFPDDKTRKEKGR